MTTQDQYLLRPKQRPALGVALRIIAVIVGIAVFFSLIAFIVVAVTNATPDISDSEWFGLVRYVLFIAAGALFYLVAKAYGWFARWGKQHLTPFAEDVLAIDQRSPVVYLRSFADDDSVRWEEEALADVAAKAGPFVAVGRPGEKLPPLGASRFYLADANWQGFVANILKKASLVILVAGRTPGLAWELRQCKALLDPRKLIIIVPTDDGEYTDFRSMSEGQADLSLIDSIPPSGERQGVGRWRGIISFDEAWQPQYAPFKIPDGKEYEAWEHFFKNAAPSFRLQSTLHPVASAIGLGIPALPPSPTSSTTARVHSGLRWITYVAFALFLLLLFAKQMMLR